LTTAIERTWRKAKKGLNLLKEGGTGPKINELIGGRTHQKRAGIKTELAPTTISSIKEEKIGRILRTKKKYSQIASARGQGLIQKKTVASFIKEGRRGGKRGKKNRHIKEKHNRSASKHGIKTGKREGPLRET